MIVALTLAAACAGPAVDREKLDRLYRTAKGVETATHGGATLDQFSSAVQALATEVSVARDLAATPEEREMLDRYGKALRIYQDSVVLWSAELKADGGDLIVATRASSLDSPAPTVASEVEPVARRHGLATREVPEGRETRLAFLRRAAARDRRLETLWLKAVFMTEEELHQAFARAGVSVHPGEIVLLPSGSYRALWTAAARHLTEGHRLYRGAEP